MENNVFCKWQYNQILERLTIVLPTKNIVATTLLKKHLNTDGLKMVACDIADFDAYNHFINVLSPLGLHQDICEKLAYSAVATTHFLIPTQPKSWYFNPLLQSDIDEFGLVRLQVKQTGQWITALVTNVEDGVANCLLLEDELNLNGLSLTFGEPFRVFANRLEQIRVQFEQSYLQIA